MVSPSLGSSLRNRLSTGQLATCASTLLPVLLIKLKYFTWSLFKYQAFLAFNQTVQSTHYVKHHSNDNNSRHHWIASLTTQPKRGPSSPVPPWMASFGSTVQRGLCKRSPRQRRWRWRSGRCISSSVSAWSWRSWRPRGSSFSDSCKLPPTWYLSQWRLFSAKKQTPSRQGPLLSPACKIKYV